MATHYEFYVVREGRDLSDTDQYVMSFVHCENFTGTPDTTLCGHAFEGECDGSPYGSSMIDARETYKKIDCPECIEMIKKCKAVSHKEIKRQKVDT